MGDVVNELGVDHLVVLVEHDHRPREQALELGVEQADAVVVAEGRTERRADLDTLELAEVVVAHPTSSLAWALLSDEAAARGADLEAYAYARVGYHRGLDSLRRAGWRGQGPVPWSHEPNRGVLRSLWALRRGAAAIGEADEVERLTTFLDDADPAAAPALEAERA